MSLIEKLKILILPLIMFPTNAMATSSVKVDGEFNKNQISCLAKNAYYEARNQPFEGKVAVMQVVMNRTQIPKFKANTPCRVIYSKDSGKCQFSWVCTRNKPVTGQDYLELERIARLVYTRELPDNTNGSVYFHVKRINYNCSHKKVIKDHVFCR